MADPERGDDPRTKPGESAVRLAIPLGTGVIVAIFVALGIEGEVFSRLIRNFPWAVAIAMILAVFGVTLPLLLKGKGKFTAARIGTLGAVLLLAGAGVAIVSGAIGTSFREQPTVTIEQQGVVGEDGTVTFKITASGLSLRSDDHLLLRVAAFSSSTRAPAASGQCRNSDNGSVTLRDETGKELADAGGRLLTWEEAGPTATGTVSSSTTLTIDRDDYTFLCALAVLSGAQNDLRFTSNLLDMRYAVATPTPSPVPTTTVTVTMTPSPK